MDLIIDVGNSYIKCGLYHNGKITHFRAYATKNKINLVYFKNYQFKKAIIASVVSKKIAEIKRAIKKISSAPIVDVCHKNTSLKISKQIKEKLGVDLTADLLATKKIYGGPAVIFDIGTACKILLLDKNNVFIGASFFPGIKMSFKSLAQYTEGLPNTKLLMPNDAFGFDTHSCIRSGVIYSLTHALEGFALDASKKIGDAKLILTGAGGNIIKDKLPNFVYHGYLTLLGIYEIYREQKNELQKNG